MLFVYFMVVDLKTVQTKLVADVIQMHEYNNKIMKWKHVDGMDGHIANAPSNNNSNRLPSHQLFSVQFRFENNTKITS